MGDLDKIQHAEFREAFDEFDKVGCCDICPPEKCPTDICFPGQVFPQDNCPPGQLSKGRCQPSPCGGP